MTSQIKKILDYLQDVKNTKMWYDPEHDMWFPGDMDEEIQKAKDKGLL